MSTLHFLSNTPCPTGRARCVTLVALAAMVTHVTACGDEDLVCDFTCQTTDDTASEATDDDTDLDDTSDDDDASDPTDTGASGDDEDTTTSNDDDDTGAAPAPCEVLTDACINTETFCATNPCEADKPIVANVTQIVPSEGVKSALTGGSRVQRANNNLDIIFHAGRLYFAFRTGPNHFASDRVQLHVVSTTDEKEWRFEATFDLDRDLREPRFLSLNGRLWLYFARLGVNAWQFTPDGMSRSEMLAPGMWSAPEDAFSETFIPWRAKVIDGKPYLLGYTGGANIYDFDKDEAILCDEDAVRTQVNFLTTDDGETWRGVVEEKPVVNNGGGSETDFALLSDGSIVAVMRNEEGEAACTDGEPDDFYFGSKICRAPADALADWECTIDPLKYDSPLVIQKGDDVYLVGRRNLDKETGETAPYDLQRDELSFNDQLLQYQAIYSNLKKRCSLWKVDPDTLTVDYIDDLPSRGDTCFASAVDLGEGRFLLYNYTSPFGENDPDPTWAAGQGAETIIYSATIVLP